jgi:hypothetical protein
MFSSFGSETDLFGFEPSGGSETRLPTYTHQELTFRDTWEIIE